MINKRPFLSILSPVFSSINCLISNKMNKENQIPVVPLSRDWTWRRPRPCRQVPLARRRGQSMIYFSLICCVSQTLDTLRILDRIVLTLVVDNRGPSPRQLIFTSYRTEPAPVADGKKVKNAKLWSVQRNAFLYANRCGQSGVWIRQREKGGVHQKVRRRRRRARLDRADCPV